MKLSASGLVNMFMLALLALDELNNIIIYEIITIMYKLLFVSRSLITIITTRGLIISILLFMVYYLTISGKLYLNRVL